MCKGVVNAIIDPEGIISNSSVMSFSSLSMERRHQVKPDVVKNKQSAAGCQSLPCETEDSSIQPRSILFEKQLSDNLQAKASKAIPYSLTAPVKWFCQPFCCNVSENKLGSEEEMANILSDRRRCSTDPVFSLTSPSNKAEQLSATMSIKRHSGQNSQESLPTTAAQLHRGIVCWCFGYQHHHHRHHAIPYFSQRQILNSGDNYSNTLDHFHSAAANNQSDISPSHRPIEKSLISGMTDAEKCSCHVESSGESDFSSSDSDDGSIVVEDDDEQARVEIQGLAVHLTGDGQSGQQSTDRRDGGYNDNGDEHRDSSPHGVNNNQVAQLPLKISTRSFEAIERKILVDNPSSDNASNKTDTVLIFVYGTLKKGYCNHYNLETDGIKYFQDGITIHPYVLYLDSANRSRPCLSDGSSCPIGELFDHQMTGNDDCNRNESLMSVPRSESKGPELLCPLCCLRQRQQRLNSLTGGQQQHVAEHHQRDPLCVQSLAKSLKEVQKEGQSRDDEWPSAKTKNSKHWGLPVRGELYVLNFSLLATLDRFERVPNHYTRQTITVRGLIDQEFYNAEVYFNRTSSQRWCELLDGRFQLLRDYTLDHHRLYQPRGENHYGLYRHQKSIFNNRAGSKV